MKLLFFIISLFFLPYLHADSDIEQFLNENGIKHEKITSISGFKECFRVLIKQPIDHDNINKGYFTQKIYLSHIHKDSMTAIHVNGYISFTNRINDWVHEIKANQLYVEHRYFGQSVPSDTSYDYLNLINASRDLHRIKQLFDSFYSSSWLSVGISKGGLTALSYKYFYPDDVDVTLSLSTSIKLSVCDTSYIRKIDSLNIQAGCFNSLHKFQEKLLVKKDSIIPYMKKYLLEENKSFSKLPLATIYEIAVMEIPFSLWQNARGCSSINYEASSHEDLFNEIKKSLNGWFMTDDVYERSGSYHYQANTELGYYCYPVTRFKDLLSSPLMDISSVPRITPKKTTYSNKLMTKLKEWAINSGENIIYLSGGNDPYSYYSIEPRDSLRAASFIIEGNNHNEVNSYNVPSSLKEEVLTLIYEWTSN